MKTMVSWPRDDAYYDPQGWKGKRFCQDGNAVNDSIAMNATAHYLHNMLFILGEAMEDDQHLLGGQGMPLKTLVCARASSSAAPAIMFRPKWVLQTPPHHLPA